jgi:hypothetical protein
MGLRVALDRAAEERQRKTLAKRAEKLDKVLATFPELTRAPDRKGRAAFLLRLVALQDLGRDCQRYAEMRRYLDLTGWKGGVGSDGYGQLWKDATALAVEVGYAPAESVDPRGHRDAEFKVQTRGAALFTSVGRFFYDFPSMLLDVPASPDLLTTMTRCMSPPEQLAELRALQEAVRNHGVGGERVFDYPATLSQRLEWSALAIRARSTGVDAAMAAHIADLTAAWDDEVAVKATGGGTARQWVESQAREIASTGLAVERARAAKLGFTDTSLRAALEAVAAGDAAHVAVANPSCTLPLQSYKAFAAGSLTKPAYAAATIAPLRDMGCIVGQKGRFGTSAEAVKWVQTAPSRARDTTSSHCVSAFAELPSHLPPPGEPPAAFTITSMLSWYYGSLVMPLCAGDAGVAL